MRPIMMHFPMPIETPRMILRIPQMGYTDSYDYVEAASESLPEISPWLAWARYVPSVDSTEEYMRDSCANWIVRTSTHVGMPLCIIDKETSKFAGIIVMHSVNWDIPRIEIGYWLRSCFVHKGMISEAVNALTRYCFLVMGMKRVEIRCEIANVRSRKVPERLGFMLDARMRNNQYSVKTGRITDTLVYSRIDLNGLPELEVRWG